MRLHIFLVSVLFALIVHPKLIAQSSLFICENGQVNFVSDAKLEVIEASSRELKGILDLNTNRFAFSINIISFTGFNSVLQLEHFRENYMEISQFDKATFEGRIIEQVDLMQPGIYNVRAKGTMTIHGESQEIFINCQMNAGDKSIQVKGVFNISLSDYNISIPKVVSRKIAEEIRITVNVELKKKDN